MATSKSMIGKVGPGSAKDHNPKKLTFEEWYKYNKPEVRLNTTEEFNAYLFKVWQAAQENK